MSYFETRRAVLMGFMALSLPGCFKPMLAEGSASAGLRGRIDLPAIDGRASYYLTRRLETLLGKPQAPDYRLELAYAREERGLAVEQDNAVTRITVIGRAVWALRPQAGGAAILEGTEVSQAGYDATTSLFATREVARDIDRRIAEDLGERVARAILAQAERVAVAE